MGETEREVLSRVGPTRGRLLAQRRGRTTHRRRRALPAVGRGVRLMVAPSEVTVGLAAFRDPWWVTRVFWAMDLAEHQCPTFKRLGSLLAHCPRVKRNRPLAPSGLAIQRVQHGRARPVVLHEISIGPPGIHLERSRRAGVGRQGAQAAARRRDRGCGNGSCHAYRGRKGPSSMRYPPSGLLRALTALRRCVLRIPAFRRCANHLGTLTRRFAHGR
jgi:hypothetical protein